MGCRVSCEMAHDWPDKALGCILLSYPLHPPGKEGQLRDSPLTELQLPMLFVRGTKDEFSQQEQWEAVMQRMQSPRLEHYTVEGAGHSLVKGSSAAAKATLEDVCQAVQQFAASVLAQAQQPAPQQARKVDKASPAAPKVAAGRKRQARKKSQAGGNDSEAEQAKEVDKASPAAPKVAAGKRKRQARKKPQAGGNGSEAEGPARATEKKATGRQKGKGTGKKAAD
ncbi:hypothetical protein N2152v2_006428 [Parachlorella kessleri]